jgi:hypothetical protein
MGQNPGHDRLGREGVRMPEGRDTWKGIVTIRPGIRDLLWMTAGATMLLLVTLSALHSRQDQTPAQQLAFKARRVDVVGGMRSSLATASEAEKSAVMALADQESQTYADQARAATGEVEHGRKELGELLSTGGTQGEKDLLDQFSRAFTEFQRIDAELLALAVKNSNLKAYGLAFGPAAEALEEMDTALFRLATKSAAWPDARNVMLLAFGAETAALRIQALLAPHIAEESDKKMDELEAVMAKEDREVHNDLDRLAALQNVSGDPDLETASSSYARFSNVRTQILALSRENTNVRSVAISLGQKRKVMLLCQGALEALQQAILAEPLAGADYGRFGRPAKLP